MKRWNTALGFYQDKPIVHTVTKELERQGFNRFATIEQDSDGKIIINQKPPLYLGWILIGFGLMLTLFLFKYFSLLAFSWHLLALIEVIFLILFLAISIHSYSTIVDDATIDRYKYAVFKGEKLLIVQVHQQDVRQVLAVLRQVKSAHPVSFLLRADIEEQDPLEIPEEPLTVDQLKEDATKIAEKLGSVSNRQDHVSLLCRLEKSSLILQFLRHDVADAEYIEQTIPLSAEWLLDNMYVIEGSIEDVKRNLPSKYYSELPKLTDGQFVHLPRIYAIAVQLVKGTLGKLTQENIIDYLASYQTQHPLTIGELWAFPLMLRLRLIEWIQHLALRIDNRMRDGELASYWGNRLLYAVRHEPERIPLFLAQLSREQVTPSPHFAEELLDHLFDEQAVIPLVREWLQDHFNLPVAEILHQEQIQETTEQIVFSNSVLSLITLSQLSWSDIFEKISPIDPILQQDPTNTYANMDFLTRNSYREAIEKMARGSRLNEEEVASTALTLSKEGKTLVQQHIGYYLIDEGKPELEQKIGYAPTFLQKIQRVIRRNPAVIYIGGICLTTAFLLFIVCKYLITWNLPLPYLILIAFLSIVPLSECAVQFLNTVIMSLLPAKIRPKMSFLNGIPDDRRALVVVPMMLLTKDSIQAEIERLEIRYLANTDPALYFGLFSDFSDAMSEVTNADAELLEIASIGIQELEKKYGSNKFFLFSRKRQWSESEKAWIGWERKRGKLEYLNRYLMGETLPEKIVHVGNEEILKGIRYVITLDADTQLPKDQAKGLIEVISHPLNSVQLNEQAQKVVRGYTIIQPRVLTDFTNSKCTKFSCIYSEPAVVDPYTQAISNIYQDLTAEASYQGKGIYEVKPFHTLLSQYFPNEHLLSHDLLEGSYVRCAFASHVCLFDSHPENYFTWAKRNHRWMRGDLQIIDWLFPNVPTVHGKKKNPLSIMNRWKIFDNIRRLSLPIFLIALLMIAWIVPSNPLFWTSFCVFIVLLPCISLCFSRLWNTSLIGAPSFFVEFKQIFKRCILNLALLPFEAYLALDAVCRVFYRRFISQHDLLQWSVSEPKPSKFPLQLMWVSIFAILIGVVSQPQAIYAFIPICLLWLLAPLLVYLVDKPIPIELDLAIQPEDRLFLRMIARKTWRYFDELVGPQTHWLPPDNYQAALKIEVAERTSPTNIGMWLMSVLNAYDFKFITCDQLIDKTFATLHELQKMERFEGHFLNWYQTRTLEPLYPKYISTVDSGNLLACFWTLKQGLEEIVQNPVISQDFLVGVQDAYAIFHPGKTIPVEQSQNLWHIYQNLQRMQEFADELKDDGFHESKYWLSQIHTHLESYQTLFSRYFGWVIELVHIPDEQLSKIDPQAIYWKNQALSLTPSLYSIAQGKCLTTLQPFLEACQKAGFSSLSKKLHEALASSQWLAGEKLGQVQELTDLMSRFSQEMNLGYLYNEERKLFAIGFNVDNHKLDTSYYDLLASEARIASLVAIAKEDAPLEHWWALGRIYSILYGKKVLLSWGGTMFEYLMPTIFNRHYKDSLIGSACDAAVYCQIQYGKKKGIPWGISESAFSAIDAHKIYQYKSFGVPGLGLKRGLEEDLVVSPYSTALALAVDPQSAMLNLRKLAEQSHRNLIGPYGYYESTDYTRAYSQEGERGVIVYTYMAHHQGMIFCAINNLLNRDLLANRFHKDPRILGVKSLLYERISSSPPVKIQTIRKDVTHTRLMPFSQSPIMGVIDTPESVVPKVNLLSNEDYSLMITNAGSGYSRFRNIDITRWRSDTTRDHYGSYIYIQDVNSKQIWSATYQPTVTLSDEYSVNFKGDKAEFRRKDEGIETFTEIFVSPEDNAEIRLMTLMNHSSNRRTIALTSYMELALAPHLTDKAHPCFNKLFIETEKIPDAPVILAFRRLRSEDDPSYWTAHLIAQSKPSENDVQYETDRSQFIGRGRTLKNPQALYGNLSHTTGFVLDPIFSLRSQFTIEAGESVQISFITAIADNRSNLLTLVDKYKELTASHRALELSWAYSQLEMRHLRIQQEDIQFFRKLASRILYPQAQLRAIPERIMNNRLGQSCLWVQGISGDLPIVVATIGDLYDMDLIKQMLIAHTFWNMRGLKTDLVILNEEEMGYFQPLHDQVQNLVQSYSHRTQAEAPGGVFLRNSNLIPKDELNLILSVARTVIIAARGSLRQQLVSPVETTIYPPQLKPNEKVTEVPSRPLPFMELPYFNGLGGYTQDGCAYVIYLGPNTNTPAPWVNILANPQLGTIVTESGLGCCWYGNSQSNRLTPWSNDPLLNPITDVLYIRDEEMGTYWTPTPAPIRELDAYRITHGMGYSRFEHNSHGIEQELLIFVPVDKQGGLPVRIQRLRLTNRSSKIRYLTVTSYSECILGIDHEETQMHVFTKWDVESQSVFAYNHYHPDFGDYLAFSSSLAPITSYTGDRTEFIGRNSSTAAPFALKRVALSNRTGAALDPCASIQVPVTLKPDEQIDVIFILGYAQNEAGARNMLQELRASSKIDQLFEETQKFWRNTLGTIQVDIPDLSSKFSLNNWFLYQNISCRFWGRTAFYQSSGAYGFRDQLQDAMAIVYSHPEFTREHILKTASRQFVEGDVQHWWHPPSGGGVRTRISDDLLWLPFATAHYIRVTGDSSILQEQISFLESPLLTPDEHEAYQVPTVSQESATLLEHCRRAIQKGKTSGPHGLPLMGTGDWNDGMNLVGVQGKGESVWLAWFLIHVLHDFADLLRFQNGHDEAGVGFISEAQNLAKIIENTAWDGAWYRRAYFDDGTPLGSHENEEAFIDSLAQSWAVISGLADSKRCETALKSAEAHLVKAKEHLVLLLTTPFDKTTLNPGYIKGYPPGVRENGGQYTHGSSWLAMAFARMGDGNKAVDLLKMMSPTLHTPNSEANALYKVEPYVLAGDVYDLPTKIGMGGWTWYTGSAGWIYRIWLEEVLGFHLRGQTLQIQCTIPKEWDGFEIHYRYKTATYHISVKNPEHVSCGASKVTLDDNALPTADIPLIDDGKEHFVVIVLSANQNENPSN